MEDILSEVDLKLNLLLNKPIYVENIGHIHSVTLKDIVDLKISKYNYYLSWICINSNDIKDIVKMQEEIDPFDFIISNCFYNEDFKIIMEEALSFFLRKKIYFNKKYFYVEKIEDFKIIDKKIFNVIRNVIMYQNCIKKDSKKTKGMNDKQREYYEKVAKMKQKYDKIINADEGDLSDIISSVAAKHPSINLLNIENLTVYQLLDQFKRLNKIDEYFIAIDSLLAGCSKEDVNVVHWSKKLDIN